MNANPISSVAYQPSRQARKLNFPIRGLRYAVRHWPVMGIARQQLLMLHGWMDVAASFQFLVDQLPEDVEVFAPDWRGYGHSSPSLSDTYWFADYLGDLDALIRALVPEYLSAPIQLLGHSMGGNVACLYAGIRPEAVGALINLEGLGMPATDPSQAPLRYARWLDELAKGSPMLKPYPDRAAVAERLMRNNSRLRSDFAAYLAEHWAERSGDDGQWHLLADPHHKGIHPVLYRVEEVLACWRRIEAPVLWVCSEHMNSWHEFVKTAAYQTRLHSIAHRQEVQIADAGHMLHHDQPQALAQVIMQFLDR